jgi:hypothetical protein
MIEVNLYEDIYSPSISGEIVLQDSLGLISNYYLNGTEFIEISLQKTSENENVYNKNFRVYKISKRTTSESNNYEVYILNFCSEELLISEQFRLSKSAKGKEIYNIVIDILFNYLKTKKNLDWDITSGIYDFVLPNKKLFETINWLTTYAQTVDNSGDMLFYENGTGYNFKSLQSLYGKSPYQTYKYDPKNIGDSMNQKVTNALDFEVLDFFDTLSAIANGTFANKVITIDPLLRNYDTTTGIFNYADFVNSSNPMNGFGVTNNYKNRLKVEMYGTVPDTVVGVEMGALRMTSSNKEQKFSDYVAQSPDSVANDIRIEQYLPARVSQLALANYMRIKLSIAGDPSLVAGQTVNFNTYTIDPKTYSQGGNNVPRELDPFYSGKYLVSAVRHIIKNNSYITIVELCKESVSKSYPSFDSSDSNLTKYVNGA